MGVVADCRERHAELVAGPVAVAGRIAFRAYAGQADMGDGTAPHELAHRLVILRILDRNRTEVHHIPE